MIDEKQRQDTRDRIGSNVVRLREERGMLQDDLAKKAGITRIQVSRIENGHHEPTATVLFALADALGVPADYLRNIPTHAA